MTSEIVQSLGENQPPRVTSTWPFTTQLDRWTKPCTTFFSNQRETIQQDFVQSETLSCSTWFRNAARTNHVIFSISWTESTPKTNMEPENHSFEKENHLPNLHFSFPFHVNFRGCDAWRFWKMGQPPQDLLLLGSLSPLNHDYGSTVRYFFLNNLSMLLTCNSKKLQMKALVLNPSIMDKCFRI